MGIMPLVLCHFRELQAHVHDNTFSPTIDATSVNVNNILQKVTALANKACLLPTSHRPATINIRWESLRLFCSVSVFCRLNMNVNLRLLPVFG